MINEFKWITLGIVAGGGALGSITRYLTGLLLQNRPTVDSFPWGTFTVNLIGSFLIGFFGALWMKLPATYEWRLFLITGFLGGFTTFSAFSFESYQLYQQKPSLMFIYIATSIFGGLTLCAVGFWLGTKAT